MFGFLVSDHTMVPQRTNVVLYTCIYMHVYAWLIIRQIPYRTSRGLNWENQRNKQKMSIVQSNIEMGVGGSQEREKPRERKYCQTRPAPGSQVSTSARWFIARAATFLQLVVGPRASSWCGGLGGRHGLLCSHIGGIHASWGGGWHWCAASDHPGK